MVTVRASEVQTVSPRVRVADAARTMLDERIHHLVVVDNERRPVQILTKIDLVEWLVRH